MKNKISIIQNKSEIVETSKIKKAAYLSLAIDEEKRQSQIETIDYAKEKERFLNMHASNSKQTERTYKTALKTLEDYTTMHNLNILDMRSSEADDFVIALKNNKELSNDRMSFEQNRTYVCTPVARKSTILSANTVRLITAGCSSFFTQLERNFTFMKNPFRGTKTRPRVANKKNTLIPNKKEMALIIANTKSQTLRTVIIFIKETGVRIGALSSLEIVKTSQGYIYKAHSKGRDVKGLVPLTSIKAIAKAGLNNTKPFAHLNTEVLRVSIYNSIKALHTKKLVNHCYSVHDLRHYFAVENYTKEKDIYKLKKLLNHASISVTEKYLQSMDLEA